jgi:hypothetical protein
LEKREEQVLIGCEGMEKERERERWLKHYIHICINV